MPPSTTNQNWPPASPTQLASALLTSIQRMTSSARLLLIGCFQCKFLKAGCWRRQEEHDGAWFDCDKLQVEHPYCYVNPVALPDATPATALCHTPPSQHATPTPPRATHPGGPPKASPQRSPGSALAPRGVSLLPGAPPPKCHIKANVNSGFVSESEMQYEKDNSTADSPVKDSMDLKDGVARYVRGQGGRTSLVESFAAKLEADLRRLEYDRQRAEGEVVALAPTADDNDWLKEYSNPNGRNADFLLDTPSNYPFDELENPPHLSSDVWKPSELENVFECYNMTAFYSYGAACPVGEKFASRIRGERFEEVFPVSPRNNNNSINNNNNNSNNKNNKVYKATSDGESSSPPRVAGRDQPVTENVPGTAGYGEKRECSQDQLKQYIDACVFAESITEVNEKCFVCDKDSCKNCHNMINFGGKSFNKLLVFNLVKSTMSECAVQYPRSMPLCSTYPVHLVQNKVINVMVEEDKNEENLCGLQMFHSSSLSTQRERHMARRLVVGVTAAEVQAEDQQWQDFRKEEQEMKEAIVNEVLHDLISDTADVFKFLLAKKLSVSQEPDSD